MKNLWKRSKFGIQHFIHQPNAALMLIGHLRGLFVLFFLPYDFSLIHENSEKKHKKLLNF